MSPPDAASHLLTLAQKDFKAALILAHAAEPQMNSAGFHLQQAVEKALKAWLANHDVVYPRTHDLSLLLGLIEDRGEDVSDLWTLLELNPFAVQFRYELPGEDFPDFDSLARQTEQLLGHVESLIANG